MDGGYGQSRKWMGDMASLGNGWGIWVNKWMDMGSGHQGEGRQENGQSVDAVDL